MSIDLGAIASSFGCSVEDVKELLGGVVAESYNIMEIINGSIVSEDYESIMMACEMLKEKINHFGLTDMANRTEALLTSANTEDRAGVQAHYDSLKGALDALSGEL